MSIQPKLNQHGDTIVEVLIAVAVVSAVIVGAFSIANRSSMQVRAAQERSEALKFAASAVESIKANPTAAKALAQGVPYCPGLAVTARTGGAALEPTAADTDGDYNPTCQSPNTGVPYFTSITQTSTATSTFQIHTRWDRVGGGSRQDITLSYRIDK